MKVAIIGYGGRGNNYGIILRRKNIEICAVCDIDENKLKLAQKDLDVPSEGLYNNEDEFFAKGKIADILLVCTQDNLHKRHAIKGLQAGYDLLLEKPISTSIKNCKEIADWANKLNKKVFIFHVLRYAPFFNIIKKELETGKFGKVISINLSENVAFWHQAHSYVRGNWRNDKTSTPMIIAKCCHDLDLIAWFMGEKCTAVSSFGALNLFKEENAPEGSANYCLDCRYNKECEYSAERFYIKERAENGRLGWPCDIVVSEPTKEKLYQALKDGPYGKCVYKCDNNVVDHQVVNMQFKSGATAHLTMTAFTKENYRRIHVYCEHGEIYGNMTDSLLHINLFGKEEKVVDAKLECNSYGHGGGDEKMLDDMINYLSGKECKGLTSIDTSIQSHIIGYNAEKSRLKNGKVIKI